MAESRDNYSFEMTDSDFVAVFFDNWNYGAIAEDKIQDLSGPDDLGHISCAP